MNETTLRLILAATVVALLVGVATPRSEQATRLPDLSSPAATDEVLVHVSDTAFGWPDAVLASRLGGKLLDRMPEIGFVRLGLGEGEEVAAAVHRIGGLPFVRFVEPNHLLQSTQTPNDPLFSGQSHYLSLIEAPQAWLLQEGRSSVLVAVLDSGVDVTHPDLEGKVWLNVLETANGADDDRNGCVDDIRGCNFVRPGSPDPACQTSTEQSIIADDNGHGTFISGIIAARGNNGVGGIGAAPGVTILPVKILDCLGGGTAADAAQGILYAARVGARVANISFGADGESQTLANAIRVAHLSHGMVIVAATGNNGHNTVSFPARLPEAIAVASSGTAADTRVRSPFSDWGPEVAVAAPGLNIISTVPAQFCGTRWFCVDSGPYALASGTSFAAPLVSALAALIISQNPNISPQAVLQIIQQTAEPLPPGDTPGWAGAGRIRMRAALDTKRYFIGAPAVVRQ